MLGGCIQSAGKNVCDLKYVFFDVVVCTVTEYGDNSPW